jgi:hypothetical protein
VKNGACWEGIRLTQDKVNPGGSNALKIEVSPTASANFGYCLNKNSLNIKWFINKVRPF